jgi:acyl-phosphate glycerol 3-phosphate acyltransferase
MQAMYFLLLLVSMIFGYLAGSVNFAILITRWVRGIDIRTVGNKRPGTANVGREIGKGWAALVLSGDLAKGLIPLFIAKSFLFPDDNYTDYFALFLIGMSVISGHCWPIFFGFRGGGGLATAIGVYMFFVPLEFLAALILAFMTVQLFFHRKKYPHGQLTPMFFIPLANVLVILSSFLTDKDLPGSLKLGGHPWYVITGVIVLSVYIVLINIRVISVRFSGENPI